MALSLTRFLWMWFGGNAKDQESNGSSANSVDSWYESRLGLEQETESCRFYSMNSNSKRKSPSNPTGKRKTRGYNGKRINLEDDVVLVPSDGVYLSGSKSCDSDWSIGWLEPLDPGFRCYGDAADSFAALVPCYSHYCREFEKNDAGNSARFLGAVKNSRNGYSDVGREHMERWISSLGKF